MSPLERLTTLHAQLPILKASCGDLGWMLTLQASGGQTDPTWSVSFPIIDRNGNYTGDDDVDQVALTQLVDTLVEHGVEVGSDWEFATRTPEEALAAASSLIAVLAPRIGPDSAITVNGCSVEWVGDVLVYE